METTKQEKEKEKTQEVQAGGVKEPTAKKEWVFNRPVTATEQINMKVSPKFLGEIMEVQSHFWINGKVKGRRRTKSNTVRMLIGLGIRTYWDNAKDGNITHRQLEKVREQKELERTNKIVIGSPYIATLD